jgi:hypothetical protein
MYLEFGIFLVFYVYFKCMKEHLNYHKKPLFREESTYVYTFLFTVAMRVIWNIKVACYSILPRASRISDPTMSFHRLYGAYIVECNNLSVSWPLLIGLHSVHDPHSFSNICLPDIPYTPCPGCNRENEQVHNCIFYLKHNYMLNF